MINIHHLNCLKITSPITDYVIGHCLLLDHNSELTLIDTGIGLLDTQDPISRFGKDLIDIAGFQFDENLTAYRQIQKLGLDPKKVTNCIITHLDVDHIGGLADFPDAVVHVGIEELDSFRSGNIRYLPHQLDHHPGIQTYPKSNKGWFGFEAREIKIIPDTEIYLIPLFGHTHWHCGVAINDGGKWIFYVGDAYYMRVELNDSRHPVNELATMRADNNGQRLETLDRIRRFVIEHPEILVFGYHDITEFPN